jgi:hypothetical protein
MVSRARYAPRYSGSGPVDGCRLEAVAALPLYGAVEDLVVLRGQPGASGRRRDSLLLAFRWVWWGSRAQPCSASMWPVGPGAEHVRWHP